MERASRRGYSMALLNEQLRMIPEISDLVSELHYDHVYPQLKEGRPHVIESLMDPTTRPNAARVRQFLRSSFNIEHNFAFLNVEGTALDIGSNRTKSNATEADVVWELVNTLIGFEIPAADIAIITPYKGQVALIKTMISDRVYSGNAQADLSRVVCTTVDAFHSQERSVVITSLVNDSKLGLMNNRGRQVVSTSRAKDGLIMLGNYRFLTNLKKRSYADFRKTLSVVRQKNAFAVYRSPAAAVPLPMLHAHRENIEAHHGAVQTRCQQEARMRALDEDASFKKRWPGRVSYPILSSAARLSCLRLAGKAKPPGRRGRQEGEAANEDEPVEDAEQANLEPVITEEMLGRNPGAFDHDLAQENAEAAANPWDSDNAAADDGDPDNAAAGATGDHGVDAAGTAGIAENIAGAVDAAATAAETAAEGVAGAAGAAENNAGETAEREVKAVWL